MSEVRGSRSDAGGAEDRLDAAIDRAVREMLDVEPPAGLRGRVLQRIQTSSHGGRAASGSGRWLVWAALPIAVAVVMLALLLPRPSPPTHAPVTAAITRPAANPPAAPPRRELPRVAPSPRADVMASRRAPASGAAERRIAAASIDVDTEDTLFAVAPLARPEALTIRELETPPPSLLRSTAPEPMHIRALEISALPETPRERHEE
jgi:hypothetical protein